MLNVKVGNSVRKLALLLIVSLSTTMMPLSASADLVTAEQIYAQQQVEQARNAVKGFVARDEVRAKMLELGVSQVDVDQRIDNLTDQEVLKLHEDIDSLPAGEGFLGFVIGLLVVFILLDVAGVTDIFPSV